MPQVFKIKSGKCLLCNNNSDISPNVLRNLIRIIEARSEDVIQKWISFFGEIEYYC